MFFNLVEKKKFNIAAMKVITLLIFNPLTLIKAFSGAGDAF